MKSARDWNEEIHNDPGMASDLEGLIGEIQADALEHTATTAAQHDARVKAEALRDAITDLCGNAHRSPIEVLRDRAAAIMKGAGL